MKKLIPFDFARKDVFYCGLDDKVSDVANKFLEHNIGSLVVQDKNKKNVGLITDAVILETLSAGAGMSNLKVKDLSLEPLITAKKDAGLKEVMEKIKKSTSGRVILVDDKGKIVAIVKEKNLVRFWPLLPSWDLVKK